MKSGPIIIIDNDAEDHDILKEILEDLQIKNEIVWIQKCEDALTYLSDMTNDPFMIFCDINLPVLNGINFKRELDKDPELKKRSIPFLFYSTSASQELVNDAYMNMTVQGFFEKGNNYAEMKHTIKIIIDYWRRCRHPRCDY